MNHWSKVWSPLWPSGKSGTASGIDLGDGRVLNPEDVLEGHYRRVRGRVVPAAVQVNDSLVAAIGVLAPNLAPLTAVAEEVATMVPPVAPEPEFRAHLHQALEQTHRQHAAQRILGTRPVAQPRRDHRGVWLIVLVAAIGLLLAWRSRPSSR